MVDETPLQRVRREYEQAGLPPAVRDRIWRRLRDRTPTASVGWVRAWAVGAAAGCAVMAGVFWFKRPDGNPAVQQAIALDVRGVVEAQAESADSVSRLVSKQEIRSGAWLETQPAASLRIAIGAHRAELGGATRIRIDSLSEKKLTFSLAKGVVQFKVDPLPRGVTLSVHSGELRVEVVGTVFSVERSTTCSVVVVTEGRVRTNFAGRVAFVEAGQSERYCGDQDKAASPGEPPPPMMAAPSASSEYFAPVVSSPGESPNEGPASVTSRPLTQEERGFRRGIDALKSGASPEARQSFEEYLQRYPAGTFAQDARFHLIRLAYTAGDGATTVTLGRQFLEQRGDHGARSNEVRLLVAQSLLQHGDSSDEAFALLAPLVSSAEASHGTYAEQTVYLYVLAAKRSGRDGEARAWAKQYLNRYPTGRYSEEVAKIANP